MVKEETLKELALSRSEYNLILDKLDREPNDLELGLFGALWSEHCGYKHTKKLLRSIKSTSEFTLTEAGAENAGAVDIGSNKAIVMKILILGYSDLVQRKIIPAICIDLKI